MPYFVTDGGGKTVFIPCSSSNDRCSRCSSNFGWQMLIKSSTMSSIVFRNLSLSPFFQLFVSGMQFVTFSGIFFLSSGWGCSVPTEAFLYFSSTYIDVSVAVQK